MQPEHPIKCFSLYKFYSLGEALFHSHIDLLEASQPGSRISLESFQQGAFLLNSNSAARSFRSAYGEDYLCGLQLAHQSIL